MAAPNRVCGVAYTTDEVVLTINGIADRAALRCVSDALLAAGVSLQHIAREPDGALSLILTEEETLCAEDALSPLQAAMQLSYSPDTSTSRVAVVGRAVHTDEKVLQAVCDALERKKVPARWVDASRSCLSCLVPRQRVEAVVCAFHDALRLGIAPRSGVSCLPYAGCPA